MQVNLDLNRPYMSQQRPAFQMKLANPEALERKVSTGTLNLIQNGLAKKGHSNERILVEEFPDMALLSKIDFNKFNGKSFETSELGRGRNINDVVKKLVEFAKA